MRRILSFSVLVAIMVLGLSRIQAAVTGQWDFNSDNLNATVGQPLAYFDGPGGETDTQDQFGTTTALGIPDIGGQVANVMKFPACTATMGYVVEPGVPPTPGGASGLGETYTLILDILFPAGSSGSWRTFIQINDMANSNDAELFVNTSNGIGISGLYNGQVLANTWHRIAFVVTGGASLAKYIDGVKVGEQALSDSDLTRWDLATTALLFTDNDGDVAEGYVNSIQFRDVALDAGYIAALGGASASGIPQTTPVPAFVDSTTPASGANNVSPDVVVSATLKDADTTVVRTSILMEYDGASVTPQLSPPGGGTTTASFDPPGLLLPLSVHRAKISFQDSAARPTTTEWQFTVADYKSLTLPAPLHLETFDGTDEGTLPAGWTVTNLTDSAGTGPDLDSPASDSYADWVVISSNRLATVFGDRRLVTPPWVVNDAVLTRLVHGNLAYAESDNRSGSQVQVLFSPDYNCSGRSGIYLSFHSTYEQNQDSMGAVEYSIDDGNNWLPALYLLDGPDVKRDGGGNVDAIATFTTIDGDGPAHGAAFGDFIGAPITAALAPFISPRVNDDRLESKRVELIRLTGADNQSRVSLRFTQTGTGSWYFGIDDVGLYSIVQVSPIIDTQPISQTVSLGGEVTLAVAAHGTPTPTYQWKFGSTVLTGETGPTLTLRDVTAASEGDYTVTVSNVAGSVDSLPAHLTIFGGPISENLVVHLKLDNNVSDSSGRNNPATEVGAPSFGAGKVGSHALQIPSGADYVTLGRPADLNFGTTTDFSIAFWAKAGAWSGDPSFIGNKDWDSGGNQGYVLATDDDGHFQWNVAGPPGDRKDYDGPPGLFSDNNWHHVAVGFDRSAYAWTYIDGALVDQRRINQDENDVGTPSGFATNIGQDGTGTYGPAFTDAAIDDVGIWRRIVTPQEVAAMFAAGQAGQDLSTVNVVPTQLQITGITTSNGNVTITWQPAPGAKLQKASTVPSTSWSDLPVPEGNTTWTEPLGTGNAFYRLSK
jgi:hypothetical protein